MEKFQSSFESNTAKADKVISIMGSTLKIEKEKLQEVRTGHKSDHDDFQTSISSKIYKIQDDLTMERKIMDAISVKTEKFKVLTIKIENVEKQVNDLLSENAAMKSYIIDVTSMLLDIIETRDSMIMIMVKKHIAEKLRPVFTMLHRMEGVPESSPIDKKRGEKVCYNSRRKTPNLQPTQLSKENLSLKAKKYFSLKNP
ncbi:unnamed protein product [Lactuca saligna]|uniref:Uncharacterized protein n=1 Tax=Lactuca saligna TaxID=75948 RepID=A0AA35ZU84_LACSI|nr:unnamed protein product [Lactuca saligna]